jgi:Putative transmembrane protein (PGPGW)
MPEWVWKYVPEWARAPLEWLTHPAVLVALGVGSTLLFVLSAAGVPWFLARLPSDYLSRRERVELGIPAEKRPAWRIVTHFFRNLVGVVLLVAGILQLVLPGQGILTILVSLFLLDFPGKRKLTRRILGSRVVFRAINSIRRRAGQPPLDRGSLA